MIPFIVVSEASLRAAFTSSAITRRSVCTTKSTSDTLGVGTRTATPFSLPFSSGITSATALAAPVVVGTMLNAAARARRRSRWPQDAELVQQHFEDGGKAVGGATGVADNVVPHRVIGVLVNAIYKRGNVAPLGRSGDHYFFGSRLKVLRGPLIVYEHPCSFNNKIHLPLFPGQVAGVAIGNGVDMLAVNQQATLDGLHFRPLQRPENGIVFEQMGSRAGV
jgi:hypothetical protein